MSYPFGRLTRERRRRKVRRYLIEIASGAELPRDNDVPADEEALNASPADELDYNLRPSGCQEPPGPSQE